MCRLFGFRSSILSGVHSSLVAAENALADQSVRHPDGWGVAFYQGRFPHLIRNDRQALEDGLFADVSSVVSTRTLLAHIRQATTGKVGILNCHPFQHGPWCFAHNGQIAGYRIEGEVAERMRAAVDARFVGHILGTTDSEVAFHVFLSRLARRVEDIFLEGIHTQVVVDALQETVDVILEGAPDAELPDPNRLSFLVTNGSVMVALRYMRDLHFSTYKTRCPEASSCHAYEANRCEGAAGDGIVKHLIVSSEPIAGANVWQELRDGEYVSVDQGMNFRRGIFPSLASRVHGAVSGVA